RSPGVLTDFVPGDFVIADGLHRGEWFEVTHLEIVRRMIKATVLSRNKALIRTTEGVVALRQDTAAEGGRFDGHMLEREDLRLLRRGAKIAVVGRDDPLTGHFVAWKIGHFGWGRSW